LLFWLEAMSLLGLVGNTADALACTAKWLQVTLAQDGIQFIWNFGNAISHSAMHVYISALSFCPSNSFLSKLLLPKFHCLAEVFAGGFKEWPGVQLVLGGHKDYVRSVTFSPDGRRILSGSNDKILRVWDAERGVQVGSPLEGKGHTRYVTSVAFSPDEKRIVSGSNDKTVRVWDAERGVQV
ncbi:hypothetical protein M404DRAFT_83068, partial [Pisolithus tinctorius Marx 270]